MSSSVKDPFSILADEITLLRNDIKNLQRTSLDKQEAEDLNAIVVEALSNMLSTAQGWDSKVQQQLSLTKAEIIDHAADGANAAATAAIQDSHTKIMEAARIYAKNQIFSTDNVSNDPNHSAKDCRNRSAIAAVKSQGKS